MDIQKIIKSKGLTQYEVASRLGISRMAMTKAVNGNPTLQTIERIAAAIGCDVAEFFETPGQQLTCPHCGKPITIRVE